MINYVTGPLGAGKSAYGTRKMARALLSGRVVATNTRFVDGWESKLLKHAGFYRMAGKKARREYEREVRERYFYSADLQTLVNLRLRGHGEGRGVRVIDEAHNAMNNRDYAANNQKIVLRKMTLSRKRGWDDYIIAQNKDNTDVALRRVASIEIRLIDWQQITKIPVLGVKLLPFHLFLAQGFLQNAAATVRRKESPLFREVFLLGWWASLYDTFEDYDVADEDDEPAVWLPLRAGAALEGRPGALRLPDGAVVLPAKRGSSYGLKDGAGA